MSKVKKRCETCDKEFECWAYAADRRKTCSRECKRMPNKEKNKHLCVDCGETDPNEFYGAKKATCKKCHNKRLTKKRTDMLAKARKMLGDKCSVCGYKKCPAALEFHHVDRSEKEFVIAGARYGWSKMEKEIEKCVLLCANCHRELHYKEGRV